MKKHILYNKTFGKLTVLGEGKKDRQGNVTWHCLCACGEEKFIKGSSLVSGNAKSCGCLKIEGLVFRSTKHGKSKSHEYLMWCWAKSRAKTYGIEFDLKFTDIFIPKNCPVFGFPLVYGSGGGPKDNSATLDRINPKLGYIKNNVWVISNKANGIKNGHSINDLQAVVSAIAGLEMSLESAKCTPEIPRARDVIQPLRGER